MHNFEKFIAKKKTEQERRLTANGKGQKIQALFLHF